MHAESECAGDPIKPDFDSVPEKLTFIGLDGVSFQVPFRSTSGTLQSYLGTAFDPGDYDPAYAGDSDWLGITAALPAAAFLLPTLTYSAGSNPDIPVNGTMDLSSPDVKVFSLDLGSGAANLPYSALVTATPQDEGILGTIDGVQVPLVFDETTTAFLTNYPQLAGTTDSQGRATFSFPTLTGSSNDGTDLCIAVVVHDASTGAVVVISTYLSLQLRDMTLCGQ